MRVNVHLSDLFFNHTHPNWDMAMSLQAKSRIDNGVLESAILEDAKEFIEDISPLNIPAAETVTAEDLKQDFLKRL